MEADRRGKNSWFDFEVTGGISDPLWGNPTLAKSRIWEPVAHMWKISSQANTFTFSDNQLLSLRKPCCPREVLGYLAERILECLTLSLGLDAMCQDCEKEAERRAGCLIGLDSLPMIAFGASHQEPETREGKSAVSC